MAGAVPAELVARLSALKTRMPSYTKDEIEEVVTEMLSSMEGDLSEVNLKLYAEVESLAKYNGADIQVIVSTCHAPEEIPDEWKAVRL